MEGGRDLLDDSRFYQFHFINFISNINLIHFRSFRTKIKEININNQVDKVIKYSSNQITKKEPKYEARVS